jgi:WS/DGAT/MGAT family acyltransferase
MSPWVGQRRFADRIERAGSADLMFAALQQGPVPQQFGAIIVMEPAIGFDAAAAAATLADRICAVPRLRQRLTKVPWGCGRSIWVDDADFSVQRHIDFVSCPSPGDQAALLDVAAELLMRRLPMSRPPWHASVVTGLASGRVALILVVQHALADGIGGLAVLGSLVDGAPAPAARRSFPTPPPSMPRLAADALLRRLGMLRHLPEGVCAALDDLRRPRNPRIGRAAACSLLTATGYRHRLVVARTRVEDLRRIAHQRNVTINDIVLTAITGALGRHLERRGEHVDPIVVGVPVTTRRSGGPQALGNQLGEVRAAIPTTGSAAQRLDRVARIMRARKQTPLGLPVASVVVRALAAVGIFDWYMRRQRYLHTVITDLAGPTIPIVFCGNTITDILPMAVGGGGNVVVKFAALSYSGTLAITATADAEAIRDLDRLAADIQAELDVLITGRMTPFPGSHDHASPPPRM